MMIAPLVARTVPDGAIHCSGAAGAHETGERPQHSAAAGSGRGPPHASGRGRPAKPGGGRGTPPGAGGGAARRTVRVGGAPPGGGGEEVRATGRRRGPTAGGRHHAGRGTPGALSTTRTFPVCVLLVIPGFHVLENVAPGGTVGQRWLGDRLWTSGRSLWTAGLRLWGHCGGTIDLAGDSVMTSTFAGFRCGRSFLTRFRVTLWACPSSSFIRTSPAPAGSGCWCVAPHAAAAACPSRAVRGIW